MNKALVCGKARYVLYIWTELYKMFGDITLKEFISLHEGK